MKFFSLLFLTLFLIACNEDSKIEKLQKEQTHLNQTLDSLNQYLYRLQTTKSGKITSETVKSGEGLFQVLSNMNVKEADRSSIVLAIQDSVELSKMRVGEVFHVLRNDSENVEIFRYASNPATIHLLFKTDSGFTYKLVQKPTIRKHSFFEGALKYGETLDGTLRSVGIPGKMVGIVSSVLQCKVAFQQAREGDTFRILLEETFFEDSVWIKGKVLYAEFNGKVVGHHKAFLYEEDDEKSSYNAHYTESGEALIFDGLRYPLDRLHITSSYGSRIHPITGRRTVHHGVDYGSPTGSPVYAVAAGQVIVSGYDNLSGNKIAIKHRDGSSSWYLHLNTRAVKVGTSVSARQVIGRVGSTGRSTGPHLHLGFKNERGAWINPLTKTMIATPKLQGERLARLQKQVQAINKSIEETSKIKPRPLSDSSEISVRSRIIK